MQKHHTDPTSLSLLPWLQQTPEWIFTVLAKTLMFISLASLTTTLIYRILQSFSKGLYSSKLLVYFYFQLFWTHAVVNNVPDEASSGWQATRPPGQVAPSPTPAVQSQLYRRRITTATKQLHPLCEGHCCPHHCGVLHYSLSVPRNKMFPAPVPALVIGQTLTAR